jgi:hypothetical protein
MGKRFLYALMFLFCLGSVSAELCSYSTTAGGSDFFGVNTRSTNTTAVGNASIFISSFTAFTPRLNFSRLVGESITGGNVTVPSYFTWLTPINFSSTLSVFNTTGGLIDPSNYTLLNVSSTRWELSWNVNNYFGLELNVTFNRTFVKNVDDLVASPALLKLGAVTSDFIIQNSPTDYGVEKTFMFDGDSLALGRYINSTNWAVTWGQTEKYDCYTPDACVGTGSTLLNTILPLMVLLMMLGLCVGLFVLGGMDTKAIVFAVIAFLVTILMSPVIFAIFRGVGC